MYKYSNMCVCAYCSDVWYAYVCVCCSDVDACVCCSDVDVLYVYVCVFVCTACIAAICGMYI